MDKLVETGMLKENYRDTWIVSLFDLMVFSDFIESEREFLEYLDMHKIIYSNHSTFIDEVDLLNGFVNHDLAKKVKVGKPMIIRCGSYEIDEEYAQEYRVPFDHLEDELEMMKEERI